MTSPPREGTSGVETALVAPADVDDLARFFAACGCPCHCRYWHFEGDKNEWLDRCANRADENLSELDHAITTESPAGVGVVARRRADPALPVVGWLKLARADVTPKIFEQRYYRSLPCLTERSASTFVVGCVLVHPSHRRTGVAHALIAGAIDAARAFGASSLLALPRVTTEPVNDAELWLGPASAFSVLGFREVHSEKPYPVLRLELGPPGARA